MITGSMIKITRLCFAILLLCLMLILSSCSQGEKSEADIIKDLQEHEAFISSTAVITDYEIIKRQTDKENRVDEVYLTVYAEGEQLECVLSYVLRYDLYNEGWLLESVLRYYDGPWEISGLDTAQIVRDIQDGNYDTYFTNFEMEITSTEITGESTNSNASSLYEKSYTVDLEANAVGFDYDASYNAFYKISDGVWELQNVDVLSRKYMPAYSPNVTASDKIMDTLAYDSYEYIGREQDWENCSEIIHYTATKQYELGTETYEISIPVSFSLDTDDNSWSWSYNSDEILEVFQDATFHIEGTWSSYVDEGVWGDEWNIFLDINDIELVGDNTFSVNMDCDVFYHSGFWLTDAFDMYCSTEGYENGVMTWIKPGQFRLETGDEKDDGYFLVQIAPDEEGWFGIAYSSEVKLIYNN